MVSESELVSRLREILRSSDLNTTTPGTVRRQLENDFAIDLSERKRFISQQIDEFLESHVKNEEGDEDGVPDADDGEMEINGIESTKEDMEVGEEVLGEVEEDRNDEEEEAVNNKRTKKKRTSDEVSPKKRRGGGGFTKLCSLSPRLEEFVGTSELARTEVVKRLWAYIRENDLQDPKNRKIIRCDEKLRSLFNVDRIDMFQMNKALSKHIWPLEADESSVSTSAKEKQNKRGKEDHADEDEKKIKQKKQKGSASGLNAPIPLSEALINFLGTDETQLSRSDVVKRMWDYFKKNELQDPSDKRRILSDDKLKELFDVDSFNGFSIAKLLSSHFIKAEQ